MLQSYVKTKFVFHGIIISYEPNTENLSYLKDVDKPLDRFVSILCGTREYMMEKEHLEVFYTPIAFDKILFHYVPVSKGLVEFTIPFSEI